MTRLLFSAAVAAVLIIPAASADAAGKHRQHHHVQHGQMWRAPVSMHPGYRGAYGYTSRAWNQTARPPWAGPAECYEDLGYGRFESCDVGW